MSSDRQNLPSASSFYRYALCPGSWLLSQTAPPAPTSADAAAGTALHAHLERGTTPTDPADAELVSWCHTTEADLAQQHLGTADYTTTREQRLWDSAHRFSGQPDVVFSASTRALIIDYKFGRVAVEPSEENSQLYALSYLLLSNQPHLSEVYATILQPLASRSPRVVKFSRASDFSQLAEFVTATLENINSPHPTCIPGATQCRYCPAVSSCHALSLRVQSLPAIPTENWQLFLPEQKRAAFDAAKLARRYADEIDRLVKADLAAEHSIPGLSLAPGRTTSKVQDINAAFFALAPLGMSAEAFISSCSLSLPKLEKAALALLKEQDPSTTAKAAKLWLHHTLSHLITASTSQPSIKDTL